MLFKALTDRSSPPEVFRHRGWVEESGGQWKAVVPPPPPPPPPPFSGVKIFFHVKPENRNQ